MDNRSKLIALCGLAVVTWASVPEVVAQESSTESASPQAEVQSDAALSGSPTAAGNEVASPVSDPAGSPALGENGAEPPVSFMQEFFGNPLNLLLISGILFVFIVLRPQQKQMREHQNSLSKLKKNDKVITGSGIHGTVVQANADEAIVTLRIDDNTGARMTVNRDSITKIVSAEPKE